MGEGRGGTRSYLHSRYEHQTSATARGPSSPTDLRPAPGECRGTRPGAHPPQVLPNYPEPSNVYGMSYRVHGITDDTDTCEICGKTELRRVVMLAVLDTDGPTGELIYAGSSCAARKLATRGTRTTAARVRDAATAADRIRTAARAWADEFGPLTLNAYLAANSTALLNATSGDTSAALDLGKRRYAETQSEVAAINAGTLTGTRFEKQLPTL